MIKILIVEDSESMVKMMTTILANPNYQILVAMDATTAIGLAESVKPDIIILDRSIPAGASTTPISGTDVLSFVKRNESLKNTKVTICSGLGSSEDVTLFTEMLGADAYLVKPFDVHVLIDWVAEMAKYTVKSGEKNE